MRSLGALLGRSGGIAGGGSFLWGRRRVSGEYEDQVEYTVFFALVCLGGARWMGLRSVSVLDRGLWTRACGGSERGFWEKLFTGS